MKLSWTPVACEEYLYWQTTDKEILRRITLLIKDIKRSPFEGIGKPEPLKFELSGKWSRRIDDTCRLVSQANNTGNEILVFQCRYYY